MNVSYTNATSGMDHHFTSLPYLVQVTMHPGDHAYVTAQNDGEFGDVTVEVLMDGALVKTATSSGQYCIADAGGILP